MIWIQHDINYISSDTTIVLYNEDISQLDLEKSIQWEIVKVKNNSKKLLDFSLKVEKNLHWLPGSNGYSYAYEYDKETWFIVTTTHDVIQEVLNTGVYESRWDYGDGSKLELKRRDKMRLWPIEDILHEKILLLLVKQNKEINDNSFKELLWSWTLTNDEQEYLEEFLNW
jgi:hypothetical protein